MSEMNLFFLGVWDLPWWGHAIVALVLTHITIVAVTVFPHRHQAHRALELHPAVSHFFRLWLWLTTGMVTPGLPRIVGTGLAAVAGNVRQRTDPAN